MQRILRYLVITSLVLSFVACSPLDIEFTNPQDVTTIHDEFLYEDINEELVANDDLVELFGEENINFGPVPPAWNDSICFMVNGMDYLACVRYIYDQNNDNAIIPSHAAPPVYDGSKNLHLFYDQTQCIFNHEMKTLDTYMNYYLMSLEKTFIIGHDSLFTTYYKGKIEGNGNPTVVMIISGTLVFDTITTGNTQKVVFKGVRDYIIGKKILDYEYLPHLAAAPGSIEVKKHAGLSPSCSWDDL